MIADPPLDPGAVKATVAVVPPVFVAAPIVGAPGTVGRVPFTVAEATPLPTEFTPRMLIA